MISLIPVAKIKTDFPTKFGIPRQSGMTDLLSCIVFEKDFRKEESIRGIEGFDYLWLIWGFDKAKESRALTVRPPRLGGNTRIGVFATRSPFRPNKLGLSSVKLVSVEKTDTFGTVLIVSGADIADDTPIYDIKPYLPFTDCHPDAKSGFSETPTTQELKPVVPDELIPDDFPVEKLESLKKILSFDPRPSYRNDDREYGFPFAGYEIKFRVLDNTATVTFMKKL